MYLILLFFNLFNRIFAFFQAKLQNCNDRQQQNCLYHQYCRRPEIPPENWQSPQSNYQCCQVNEIDGTFAAQPHSDKTVRNMVVISDPERFFIECTNQYDHKCIKKRQCQYQKRDQDREAGLGKIQIKIKEELRQ